MKLFTVSYWSEGPGRSGPIEVKVIASSKKQAIKIVNKDCAVYKVDQNMTRVKKTQKLKAFILA